MLQGIEAVKVLFLLGYSAFKAFLPLPSLEVVLIPLTIRSPDLWIFYSLIGAIGTAIGGAAGYRIAEVLGMKILRKFAGQNEIESGQRLMRKYGVLAVFIGGVTPIPDFLLAYLAGLTKMNFIQFILSDGIARLLRSLLVTFCIKELGMIMNIDEWGTIFSLVVVGILLIKYGMNINKETSSAA